MAADYATLEQLKKHWSKIRPDQEDDATQKLHEASIEVRSNYPSIDQRIAAQTLDAEVVTLVVCRMVKRALDVAEGDPQPSGFESFQVGAGPFQVGGKIHNPDGNIYLNKAERRMLDPSRGVAGLPFTIDV